MERYSDAASEEDAPDPIQAADGRSVELRSIASFHWSQSVPYCTDGLLALLWRAAESHAVNVQSRYLVRMEDVVSVLCAEEQADPFLAEWQSRIRGYIPPELTRPAPQPPLADLESLIIQGNVILRWDVVEVLASATKEREPRQPIDVPHLLVAALRERPGHAALAKLGVLAKGLAPLSGAAVELLRIPDLAHSIPESRRMALADELEHQSLLVSLEDEVGAAFDADRPQRLTIDSLGVKEDAAALSSLILLRAATPPLAIGLFGAWGSGKSTLIRELQHRIHEDLAQERQLRSQGAADRNPNTERIQNAVQIEFNAWAYADSKNLWASLTSEIFDQLAAGGLRLDGDGRLARRYEALVSEVKLRSSRDAAVVRLSDHEIATLKQRIGIARETLSAAIRDRQIAPAEAAIQTAQQIAAPEPGGKPGKTYVSFAEPPRKKERDAAEIVRGALGTDSSLDDRFKAYAQASGDIARFLTILWDNARARPKAGLVAGLLILVAGVLLLLSAGWIGRLATELSPSWAMIAAAGGALLWFGRVILPAIRLAALIDRGIRQRRAAAAAAEAEARDTLGKLEADLERAEAGRRASEAWISRFGLSADGANAASPAIMLEYLMSGSADVEALRGQLGVVATVRRCFEQLDSVLQRMRSDPENAAVDRIILYIDDLDRCTPEQVSQVLQAVHLLLAFECFVVVVAVDARWLKQSLEIAQAQLKALPDNASEQIATASDYLEKIFQIAFWVRPLVDQDAAEDIRYSAYKMLIRGLASPQAAATASAAHPMRDHAGLQTSADAKSQSFAWTEPTRLDQSDAPRRKGLQLTSEEIQFMEAMGPFAAKSPRAVKRMINLYRLMRVRYRGDQLRLLLGGGGEGVPSYRELIFALALEIGLSPLSRQRIRSYVTETPEPGWTPIMLESKLEEAERPLLKAVLPDLGTIAFEGLFAAVEDVRRFSFVA